MEKVDFSKKPHTMTTVCLPVIFLVSPVIDEVGDKEGGNHREEGGANAPQGVRHLR